MEACPQAKDMKAAISKPLSFITVLLHCVYVDHSNIYNLNATDPTSPEFHGLPNDGGIQLERFQGAAAGLHPAR